MIALIAAMTPDRVIGREGRIPWNIPGEQKRFKELTMGHTIVMGRRTYEEIGRPLPGRQTIVVSTTKNFDQPGCRTAGSLTEALALSAGEDVYISGGSRLYEEALPLADVLYLTEIESRIEGDAYFPKFDAQKYQKCVEERQEGEIPYTYVTYRKDCK